MTVMMGYIAHDLRAPLSTVLQYSKDEKAVMQGRHQEVHLNHPGQHSLCFHID